MPALSASGWRSSFSSCMAATAANERDDAVARAARERWTFTFELPANVTNGGRFVARILKHLLRVWGVKCVALRDAPPQPPAAEPAPSPRRREGTMSERKA
jgi:hypothetical protein